MTIKDLLRKGSEFLLHDSQTPELDSEILLSFALEKDKTYLYAHGDECVDSKHFAKYLGLLERRKKGEPIAYITNHKEFYELDFIIDENVLIPRPETEDLVDLVFGEIKKMAQKLKPPAQGWSVCLRRQTSGGKTQKLKIVDIGTGSGCIGTALIYKILRVKLDKIYSFEIFMTDISGKALEIAKKNYRKIIKKQSNPKVNFVKMDLLKGFKNKFDIIVSNLPYIPSEEIEFLEKDVRDFEPRVALNGGRGGIEIVKQLISQAVNKLEAGGVLFIEMYEDHPNEVKYYLNENFPEWEVEFIKDSFGEWRFAKITKQLNSGTANSKTKKVIR
ncbi:MAG: peptide chain release factor N(5)-glutamine methyltransferase [Candidatus Dojkabacteria bacterium]|nr:peptide chain release factor N(5)-glutamine methyltransferase [Candidatus Dojkabacteria bacterium]